MCVRECVLDVCEETERKRKWGNTVQQHTPITVSLYNSFTSSQHVPFPVRKYHITIALFTVHSSVNTSPCATILFSVLIEKWGETQKWKQEQFRFSQPNLWVTPWQENSLAQLTCLGTMTRASSKISNKPGQNRSRRTFLRQNLPLLLSLFTTPGRNCQ